MLELVVSSQGVGVCVEASYLRREVSLQGCTLQEYLELGKLGSLTLLTYEGRLVGGSTSIWSASFFDT